MVNAPRFHPVGKLNSKVELKWSFEVKFRTIIHLCLLGKNKSLYIMGDAMHIFLLKFIINLAGPWWLCLEEK